jgi:hypothetical protein
VGEFFASGRVVDLILGLMLLEGLALSVVWRRRGRGVPPLALWVNLAAGGAMLLAVRAALIGASWVWVWIPLLLALFLHLADLGVRWTSAAARLGPAGPDPLRPGGVERG